MSIFAPIHETKIEMIKISKTIEIEKKEKKSQKRFKVVGICRECHGAIRRRQIPRASLPSSFWRRAPGGRAAPFSSRRLGQLPAPNLRRRHPERRSNRRPATKERRRLPRQRLEKRGIEERIEVWRFFLYLFICSTFCCLCGVQRSTSLPGKII